jgi:hypothetical protein
VGPAAPSNPDDVHRRNWVADRYRLANALGATNPKRARGGWTGFAGFTFQIHSALLNYVRTLGPDDLHDAPHLDYESLADFAIEDGDLIYTYEAKLTLTRTTLRAALSVLRDVYVVAAALDPGIADRLQFRITCARCTIPDPADAAAIWADADASDAAYYVASRLLIETESDPKGELYALLARKFRVSNPAAMVDGWIRQIGDLAAGGSGLSSAIVDALSQIGPEDLPFVVLSAEDREPGETRSLADGYLAGEQPTLLHLRGGFFAPLPGVDDLEGEVLSWYEQTIDDPVVTANGSVPVYWVGGPSGSGKSILALQLLAQLNMRASTTVIWLGASIERLTDAMRYAKRISVDRTVFVGLDDPFAAGKSSVAHWKAALAELSQLRHAGNLSLLPVVFCCGTSDQLETFRQSCSSEAALAVRLLEPPTPERRRYLGQWFFDRTGNEANTYDDDQAILPAQLFFEWSKREGIKSFARRFRDRVQSLSTDTTRFVETVLALNRIYVGVPEELKVNLPPVAQDELLDLENDQHFGFRRSGRAGYWLSHPHLADILYNTWFPPNRHQHTRAAHLSDSLRQLLELDGSGLACAGVVSALVATAHPSQLSGTEGVGRLDPAELVRVSEVAAAAAESVVDSMGTRFFSFIERG